MNVDVKSRKCTSHHGVHVHVEEMHGWNGSGRLQCRLLPSPNGQPKTIRINLFPVAATPPSVSLHHLWQGARCIWDGPPFPIHAWPSPPRRSSHQPCLASFLPHGDRMHACLVFVFALHCYLTRLWPRLLYFGLASTLAALFFFFLFFSIESRLYI